MSRQLAATLAVALAGLVLALALAVLASQLSTQHIGLAGETGPPSSGLVAPRPAPAPPRTTTTTTGAATTTTPAAAPGGREAGEGSERAEGGDD